MKFGIIIVCFGDSTPPEETRSTPGMLSRRYKNKDREGCKEMLAERRQMAETKEIYHVFDLRWPLSSTFVADLESGLGKLRGVVSRSWVSFLCSARRGGEASGV